MAEELRDTPSRREVSTLEKRLELREVEVRDLRNEVRLLQEQALSRESRGNSGNSGNSSSNGHGNGGQHLLGGGVDGGGGGERDEDAGAYEPRGGGGGPIQIRPKRGDSARTHGTAWHVLLATS